MKSGALVFLVAFMALAASWGGFVLAPQVQLSRSVQTNALGSTDLYPLGRPGQAKQGLEVYRANGCVYCHSQQVVQEGTLCEIVLTEAAADPGELLGGFDQAHGRGAYSVGIDSCRGKRAGRDEHILGLARGLACKLSGRAQ